MEFLRKYATPVVIVVGYAISGLCGVALYRTASPGDKLDSIAIGLLASILSTVAGILIETYNNQYENRIMINDSKNEVIAQMNKHQDGVLDACRISRYLNRDDQLTNAINDLSTYYISAISNSSDKVFPARAYNTLEICVEAFANLAKGRFTAREDERIHYMFSRIEETSNGEIKVVTWLSRATEEIKWWNGNAGQRYLQIQRDAIVNRNVTITRIIITSNQTTKDLRHLVSMLKDIDIKVMMIREADLRDEDLLVNFLICKDQWATESPGRSKGGIVSTNYEIDVYPRVRIWERLSIQPALKVIDDVEKDIP